MQKAKLFTRFLSMTLALFLVLSVGSPIARAAEKKEPTPIIYIIGRTPIYKHLSDPERRAQVPDAGGDAITDAVKEALPYVARAVFLGQWDAYCDKAYDLIMQFFEDYGLDENGDVCTDTGPTFRWSEDELPRDYRSENPYTYRFEYDCRLSPLEIADDLNDYISAVKRISGQQKVSVISRCEGTNIAFAYLYKYEKQNHYAGIDALVLYDNSTMGIEMLEAAFSGTISIDPDAASRFLSGYDLALDDETLSQFVALTLKMLQETYGIELTAEFLEGFYRHVKDTLFRRFLKSTFASTPGYWSMVNDKYDLAKKYIFGEKGDAEKYKGLIAKLDAFRAVQQSAPQMILDMKAAGVDVSAICKYGFMGNYPIYEDVKKCSDGVTGLAKQSFGAAVSDFDSTLGFRYLSRRPTDYISPDKQVDAGTGLLPDTTWYIKNYEHNPFWDSINPLLVKLCRVDGFNVKSDPAWSRYTVMEDGGDHNVTPMTAENCDPHGDIVRDGDEHPYKSFFKSIANFFRYVFEVLKLLANRDKA
ncbi:MAG: hypothetical protein IK108_12460 [Clostridia bacterium]|nr:hypothetical protein [Clostridia bacterium]